MLSFSSALRSRSFVGCFLKKSRALSICTCDKLILPMLGSELPSSDLNYEMPRPRQTEESIDSALAGVHVQETLVLSLSERLPDNSRGLIKLHVCKIV